MREVRGSIPRISMFLFFPLSSSAAGSSPSWYLAAFLLPFFFFFFFFWASAPYSSIQVQVFICKGGSRDFK
ncbi:hypothetical protein FEM48_Zijuj08G0025800 [Ziziphus jujuba var. spinosa]|uniref:Uncharacterized protein n=1 Tax=Ziziphus jujuba var. spinosa TaxID=714518 RepID=A0A978UWH4_ZIZJJ|nr:hypothetical protein FEM48_Zijuj08G0025800 [Ziziphus jujuba var. spinosa]